MKHINLIAILLLIVTSSSNCKKGSLFGDKLPPATQEGKIVFTTRHITAEPLG